MVPPTHVRANPIIVLDSACLVPDQLRQWRPLAHFGFLLGGVEQMMHNGKPTWAVERTLLTTGVLDALFAAQGSIGWRPTPHLTIEYQAHWKFQQPANRPLSGQLARAFL